LTYHFDAVDLGQQGNQPVTHDQRIIGNQNFHHLRACLVGQKTQLINDRVQKFKGLSAKLDFLVEIPRTDVAAGLQAATSGGHRKLLGRDGSSRSGPSPDMV
jgi:hypothetical protein